MFKACAAGDHAKVKRLLDLDSRLAGAGFWYQFPIHFAVRRGDKPLVELLLDHGCQPGHSTFTYNSWPNLLEIARQRGHHDVEKFLVGRLKKDFRYSPEFETLKDAIVARIPQSVAAIVRKNPKLLKASDSLGNNALHWAVITRQLPLIQRFADAGTPLEAQRADGRTPLLLATTGARDYWYREPRQRFHPSLRNTAVMIGYLLAKGAKYSISTAAAIGDRERVDAILSKDPEQAKQLNSARTSPLTCAAAEGHTHIVQLLLSFGADPNIPEEGAPAGLALFSACQGNHLDTAELLLEHGANPNAGLDSCGCCLTICKVYHGNRAAKLQNLLRAHGAITPPYEMNRTELKQALLERHEVVKHPEFLGNAMARCDAEMLDLYLDYDPNMPAKIDYWGGSSIPRSPKLVSKLLERGLDPNHTDWVARTLLHLCAERFDKAAAAILLDAGAEIDAKDVEFSETPLATAVRVQPWCEEHDRDKLEQRRLKFVRFLLRRGARPQLPDDPTWATPLFWARKHGLKDIQQLLAANINDASS